MDDEEADPSVEAPAGLSRYLDLPAEARAVVTTAGVSNLPFGFLRILPPIYLAALGVDPFLVAIFLSVQDVAGVLVGLPAGIITYRLGLKRTVYAGMALRIAAWSVFVLTPNYALLLAAAASEGVGKALYFSARSPLLSEKSGEGQMTEVFSLNSMARTGSRIAGSLLAVLPDTLTATLGLSTFQAYKPMWIITVLALAISTIPLRKVEEEKRETVPKNLTELPSKEKILKFAAVNSLLGFGSGFVIPLFSLWFYLKFAVGGGLLGPLYSVTDAVTTAGYLTAPPLAEKLGEIRSLVSTQALATTVLFAIPFSATPLLAGSLWVLRSTLMHIAMPLQSSLMMTIVNSEERGVMTGVASPPYGVAWAVPRATSKPAGGYLLDIGLLSLPFYITGVFYFASISALFYFFKDLDEREEGLAPLTEGDSTQPTAEAE